MGIHECYDVYVPFKHWCAELSLCKMWSWDCRLAWFDPHRFRSEIWGQQLSTSTGEHHLHPNPGCLIFEGALIWPAHSAVRQQFCEQWKKMSFHPPGQSWQKYWINAVCLIKPVIFNGSKEFNFTFPTDLSHFAIWRTNRPPHPLGTLYNRKWIHRTIFSWINNSQIMTYMQSKLQCAHLRK